MKQILLLDWIPTDLNKYIHQMNRNRFAGAAIKREETERVYWKCKELRIKPLKSPVKISFHWTVKNRKKDKDNITFAKKYILDGLVMAEILKNDGWNDIDSFTDTFALGKESVLITIEEI